MKNSSSAKHYIRT